MLDYFYMGFFGKTAPKRVTQQEWEEIRSSLYSKLDEVERVELEKFFRADMSEEGIESGISRAEFEAGMMWLKNNLSKHKFEETDFPEIEKYFEKHLVD